MTTIATITAIIGILTIAVTYGTDTFAALAITPAGRASKEASVADFMGNIHRYADRRMPVPGVIALLATLATAILGTTLIAHISAAAALLVLILWMVLYTRIAAPINRALTAAAADGTVPADTRAMQQRWDSIIVVRAVLQGVALLGMVLALIALR
jgi:hypothetical protein